MPTVRPNQRDLSNAQRDAFVAAVNQMHGTAAAPPAYRAFVQLHVDAMSMTGMSWGVHTMPGMGMVGRNFLSWHRRFLWQFEQRLQAVDPTVAVPYWDWIADPTLPGFLSDPALLTSWSVSRNWDPSQMPVAADVDVALSRSTFSSFQRKLEMGAHGDVHVAVGGTMDSSSSPADPVFWLHHANIDRLWEQWQTDHPTATTPHSSTVLQPPPLFGVTVASQLDITALGYSYA
jgi:Common central domain of tyrosinase